MVGDLRCRESRPGARGAGPEIFASLRVAAQASRGPKSYGQGFCLSRPAAKIFRTCCQAHCFSSRLAQCHVLLRRHSKNSRRRGVVACQDWANQAGRRRERHCEAVSICCQEALRNFLREAREQCRADPKDSWPLRCGTTERRTKVVLSSVWNCAVTRILGSGSGCRSRREGADFREGCSTLTAPEAGHGGLCGWRRPRCRTGLLSWALPLRPGRGAPSGLTRGRLRRRSDCVKLETFAGRAVLAVVDLARR